MADSNPSRPFAPFEWMIALRYLRAKRKEAFVSVISVISLVGIALGVATLIIVMSVMGGFRHQIIKSLLGFNGHVMVQAVGEPLMTYESATARIRKVEGVTWQRQERVSGTFARALTLPMPVDAEKVEASYDHGVLKITLPKIPAVRPRTVPVKVGE